MNPDLLINIAAIVKEFQKKDKLKDKILSVAHTPGEKNLSPKRVKKWRARKKKR